MLAHQTSGLLELELVYACLLLMTKGDMKVHAAFRIIVVDNDMINFVDLELHGSPMMNEIDVMDPNSIPSFQDGSLALKSRPPVILISNPKVFFEII